MNSLIDLQALASVVVAGVVLGAGLPALFALAVRALVPVAGATAPTPARKGFAYACFGVCVLAILGGVVFLAYGGHA